MDPLENIPHKTIPHSHEIRGKRDWREKLEEMYLLTLYSSYCMKEKEKEEETIEVKMCYKAAKSQSRSYPGLIVVVVVVIWRLSARKKRKKRGKKERRRQITTVVNASTVWQYSGLVRCV